MTASPKPDRATKVELVTNDLESAQAFYRAVLGWEFDQEDDGGETVARAQIGDSFIATIRPAVALGAATDPGEGSWLVTWPVDDVGAATERAAAAGGAIVVEPTVVDGRPFAVIEDATGATVGLYEASPLSDDQRIGDPRDAPISSLASSSVISVEGRSSLRVVVAHLIEAGIGFIVVDDDGSVAGVVSEHDIIRAIHDGADLDEVWAADVMSTDLVTATPHESIVEVARRMAANRVRHVLVFGDEGGVVSIRDVIEALVS